MTKNIITNISLLFSLSFGVAACSSGTTPAAADPGPSGSWAERNATAARCQGRLHVRRVRLGAFIRGRSQARMLCIGQRRLRVERGR
jgi:hypothetical protein